MTRRLLNFLTLLSLLLCVAVAVLWVRSYRVGDEWAWARADDVGDRHYAWYLSVATRRGGWAMCEDAEVGYRTSLTTREAARPAGRWSFEGWSRQRSPRYPSRAFFTGSAPRSGFGFYWSDQPATVTRDVIAPFWAAALAAAALPGLWLGRHLRSRARRRGGLCAGCGYDLRATPERCPECGTAAPCARNRVAAN